MDLTAVRHEVVSSVSIDSKIPTPQSIATRELMGISPLPVSLPISCKSQTSRRAVWPQLPIYAVRSCDHEQWGK